MTRKKKNPGLSKTRLLHFLRPRSFGRFAVAGIINTIMGVGNFPVLYFFLGRLLSVNALLVLGWVLSTTSAFLLHKLITFKSGGSYRREGIKFIVLSLLTLAVNMSITNVALIFAPQHPVVVQFVTSTVLSALLMILNYFGLNHLVFKTDTLRK